jgi:DHA1 family inner membrane transport protein
MTFIISLLRQVAQLLTGDMTVSTRHNVHVELASSIVYGPFYAALLFIPVVLARLGASPDILALYQSQTYLGLFLAAFSVMLIPRARVVLFLVIVWSIGRGAFLLTPLLPGAIGLLLLATLFWFSDGFPGAAYTEVVRRSYASDVRGRALGVVRLGMVVAMLICTPVAGYMLDHIGYQVVFPLAATFGILSAWMFIRMRPSPSIEDTSRQPARHSLVELWQVLLRDRRFAIYLLAIVGFGLGALVGIAFYPAVLVDRLHLSYTDVSWLGFAQSISWVLGLLVWGRMVDSRGGPWAMRLCFGLSIIVPLCYLLADSGWVLLPAYIVSGLTSGGVDLAFTNAVIDLAEPGQTYEYAALQRSVIGVRGLIGPFLGVWLFNAGVPVGVVFILAALCYAGAAIVMFRPEFSSRTTPPATVSVDPSV